MTFVFLDTPGAPTLIEPRRIIAAATPGDVPAALHALETALDDGLTAAGFFSYELGLLLDPKTKNLMPARENAHGSLPLLWFALCDAPRAVDPAAILPSPAATAFTPHPSLARGEYVARCRTVIDAIHQGEIYQANLTFPATFACDDPLALYAALRLRQPTAYGGIIHTPGFSILSLSPELLLERDGGAVRTRPMKGTSPRGRWPQDDDAQKTFLQTDPKSRAENLMIVDLMRNDLGRIAQTGSVRVENMFSVETHPTLHQMTTDICAQLRDALPLRDLLAALLPPGSVTGAPKIRALEILAPLEDAPRGAYCGAFGLLTRDRARLNVAIRTITVAGGRASIGIGSGVVADSDPDAEYDECLLKMRFLTHEPPEFSLIETMRWDGGYNLLDEHRARLAASAAYFGISFQWPALPAFDTPHRVRLLLHRDGTTQITATPLSETHDLTFALAEPRLDPADPFLFHKTTHRPLYDAPKPPGIDELVFTNTRGELSEGSFTTLFLEIDGTLLTPALSCGLLPGTLRAGMLAEGRCREAILTPADLARATHIYLGNSVRGLMLARQAPKGLS